MLVRDVYAFFPLAIRYTDLHRAHWLKYPTTESDALYEDVSVVFKLWSQSQVCDRFVFLIDDQLFSFSNKKKPIEFEKTLNFDGNLSTFMNY